MAPKPRNLNARELNHCPLLKTHGEIDAPPKFPLTAAEGTVGRLIDYEWIGRSLEGSKGGRDLEMVLV